MKTLLYTFAIIFSIMFTSCEKPVPVPGGGDEPSTAVTFTFGITKLPQVSYADAEAENKVNDLSLFIVGKSKKSETTVILKSAFVSGKDVFEPLAMDLERTDNMTYYVYAFGNYGKDMTKDVRGLTFDAFERFEITYPSEESYWTNGLPFAAIQEIQPSETTVNVTLKRKVARVELNFAVAENCGDGFMVDSVAIRPALHLFTFKAASKEYGATYTRDVYKKIEGAPVVYYVLENAAGEVPEITTLAERLESSGPQWGKVSSLFIKATNPDSPFVVVTYNWRLGENVTSDFNVIGDKHYTYTFKFDNTLADFMTVAVSNVAAK